MKCTSKYEFCVLLTWKVMGDSLEGQLFMLGVFTIVSYLGG